MTVTSLPARFTSACPRGMRSPSGTGPSISKRPVWSMKMVGLSLATADLSSPLTSRGDDGSTISRPGQFQSIAWGLPECCAAPPPLSPCSMWNTTGTRTCPPDM